MYKYKHESVAILALVRTTRVSQCLSHAPTAFFVRVGHAIVHTHCGADFEAAIRRLCPLHDRVGDDLLPRLAAYTGDLIQAAALAAPQKRVRSLRDVAGVMRGMVPRDEVRTVEQLNASYSLLRHVSAELGARVRGIAARLAAAGTGHGGHEMGQEGFGKPHGAGLVPTGRV